MRDEGERRGGVRAAMFLPRQQMWSGCGRHRATQACRMGPLDGCWGRGVSGANDAEVHKSRRDM